MSEKKNLDSKLRAWLTEENIFDGFLLADDKIDYGFKIKFPPKVPNPVPMVILKTKGQENLQFQAVLKIDEVNRAQLLNKDPMILRKFSFQIKKEILRQNFLYSISNDEGTYVIKDVVYDLDLSKDQLMYLIRRVFNMFALMMLIFSEVIKGPIDPE